MKPKASWLIATVCWMLAVEVWASTPPGSQDIKVVTTGVQAYAGMQPGVSEVLSDLLLECLLSRHGLRALGPSDIQALLTAEQQKLLLGCTDEGCMTELAGALGADWLIAGSVGRLDDLYVLNLQLIEAKSARITSRASTTLKNLEVITEKMGPLVDKLLGSRPKVKLPSVMLKKPVESQKPAMDKRSFCKQIKKYQKQVIKRPYEKKLTEMRKELLHDLAVTPFQKEFKDKQSCFWEVYGYTERRIRTQLYGSEHNLLARDAKLRLKDILEFGEQQEILKEAYLRGLEMEKNGTGTRLISLPFEVKQVTLKALEDTQEYRNYHQAYHQAQEVLEQALKAAQDGDKQAYLSLFTPKDPKRSRTSPKYAYDALRSKLKNGYRFETCPFGVLYNKTVERAAARFKKEGLAECCWRYMKEDYVSTDSVWLKIHQDKWRIDRW